MNFSQYQQQTEKTAIYDPSIAVTYTTMGLASEAGEVAGKIKKVFRDNFGNFTEKNIHDISSELGDVLWYVARLAASLNIDLQDVAEKNISKLQSRDTRGVISGSGDNR
jgi:NTP pyrophosphatase (non-canonical NTP hydrolase)